MGKALFLTFILSLGLKVFSQDLIITSNYDSINCKIAKVKTDRIYFSYKEDNEIRNILVYRSNIKYYEINYFPYREVPSDHKYICNNGNFQHFRFSMNGGFSYQTSRLHPDLTLFMQEYVKGLRKGYHFGGDFTYYITESLGAGLKACLFKSSNRLDSVSFLTRNGTSLPGVLSDDLSISFIGPLFSI